MRVLTVRSGLRLGGQLHQRYWCHTPARVSHTQRQQQTCSSRSGRAQQRHVDNQPRFNLSRQERAEQVQGIQWRLGALLGAALIAFHVVLWPLEPAVARTRLTADEQNTVELFKESTPSVVYITNLASKYGRSQTAFYAVSHACLIGPQRVTNMQITIAFSPELWISTGHV